MAVDPATQFQPGGLGISYSYSPVTTNLAPPIQLPGTGELWARVGQTALAAAQQAGDMLQKSPLNPAVKAQMKYAIDQYQQGQDQIAYTKTLGPMGHMLTQTGPQGATTMAPASITDPTMATRFMESAGVVPKTGQGTTGPPPAVNKPEPQTENQPTKPTGSPEGAPPGTFFNPTTGSYEPLQGQTPPTTQEQQPKQPPTAQQMGKPQASAAPASPFSAPLAQPPGPDGFQGPTQQQTTGAIQEGLQRNQFASSEQGVPAGYQSPQDQKALSDWQNTTQTEPMTAKDAMNWISRQTTKAKHATYMPHGGPQGSPAYAFDMDGGGSNIIPVSQMVQNGAGPAVAAQNTSVVLSQSDKIKQQQQAAAAGQNAPPAPGGTAPTIPPAPGQLPQEELNRRIAAATNVQSQGGPSPTQLMAQNAPGGQPAQPAQPAAGQPLYPPPSEATIPKADQDAVQAQANQMPPRTGPYTGDSIVPGTTGPYTYYRDDNPDSPSRGRVYTTLPGPQGHYFSQQRFILGTPGYQTYELPATAGRDQMWEKWGKNGYLTRDEIDKMGQKEMEPWLQRAWQNENLSRRAPTDEFNNDLDASEKLHNYLKQISDIEQTLADSGYPNLSTKDKNYAATKNAFSSLGMRHGLDIGPVNVPAGSMDAVSAGAMKKLDQMINAAQDLLKTHPKLILGPGQGGGMDNPPIKILGSEIPIPSIPGSNVISDSAWSGADIKTRLRLLDGLREITDARYKDLVKQGQEQFMKIADKHDANLINIEQNRDIQDRDNQYTKRLHTVDAGDYNEFANDHPNTPFLTSDGKKMKTPGKK